MKTIPLSAGRVAIVDDEDFACLSKHKWSLTVGPTGKEYAHRRAKKHESEKPRQIAMHRVIMGIHNQPKAVTVDHINGDGLDNRRENLRICKLGENSRNLNVAWGKYGIRGVQKQSNGKWRARIRFEYRLYHIGNFSSERDASIAYAFASKVFHGEYGSLPGHKLVRRD
jgi:hypothetical protein